ncbi:hypothetical protein [Nitrosospira sp. NRS527]|uniref:hypothetical protein n=1 Tax=Nitrosospira sp. NRS527 TaxID=155925 RepID=UPI001BD03CE9|nr:hypothetical protein [Nitrosospira sp. NRS527]
MNRYAAAIVGWARWQVNDTGRVPLGLRFGASTPSSGLPTTFVYNVFGLWLATDLMCRKPW